MEECSINDSDREECYGRTYKLERAKSKIGRKKKESWRAGTKGRGRDPKPRPVLGDLACLDLPTCLLRPNSWKREAVCMLKLTRRPSLRSFLASGCGEGRLAVDVRLMTTLRQGCSRGKLVSILDLIEGLLDLL